jgi:flavorubredoxin
MTTNVIMERNEKITYTILCDGSCMQVHNLYISWLRYVCELEDITYLVYQHVSYLKQNW